MLNLYLEWEAMYWAERPEPAELQKAVDDRVTAFDDQEAKVFVLFLSVSDLMKRKAQALTNTGDGEWTVVSHGGTRLVVTMVLTSAR